MISRRDLIYLQVLHANKFDDGYECTKRAHRPQKVMSDNLENEIEGSFLHLLENIKKYSQYSQNK